MPGSSVRGRSSLISFLKPVAFSASRYAVHAIIVYSAQMVHRPAVLSCALLAALCAPLLAGAEPGPQPPCGTAPFPPYPAEEGSPAVKIWTGFDWTPQACTGWSLSPSATVVVTVARFRYSGGAEGLRRRIGAISEMRGLRYWSTTYQKWQTLIIDAYALTGPEGDQRRPDFSPDEIAAGRSLHVRQEDNLLGKATYGMHIASASADRLVFATENSSTIRFLGLPFFQPGQIQSICFLDRESQDVWRYYSIARMARQASLLVGHDASLINRAVAVFRHLSGIPADREPPAAR